MPILPLPERTEREVWPAVRMKTTTIINNNNNNNNNNNKKKKKKKKKKKEKNIKVKKWSEEKYEEGIH